MEPVAIFPYYKVEQEISATGLSKWEDKRYLRLYPTVLETKHRQFPTKDILDLSYRAMDGEAGMLYLHTSSGMFTYLVKTSPHKFIEKALRYIG
ncbi:hypothetical protein JNUCC1_01410 [Lentibacillus sp. JNUCC-1]|uniref:hypothetical protein n=1 Tax=Lentibacillus sp. JNUCC-1 TaxID=2654513 RepID=UPI0012E934BC|nr:hypothetical protein [Lentibacillus sp. JNUCC-1]MUV37604.1 hypothetical protein [Lentibacillus sp. JNUCC-1]